MRTSRDIALPTRPAAGWTATTWLRSRRATRFVDATTAQGGPLLVVLGALLLVRVLTDDLSSPYSRYSGSLNLSAVIALVFTALAAVLLLHRRRGLTPVVLTVTWLCVWTGVAISTHGASGETVREGVREMSVVALAVIICNARDGISVPTAARLLQLVATVPAVIAIYQLATHTGMNITREVRANGTFAHPDSAAMFFALAAPASLWLYLDCGRRWLDVLLAVLFGAGVIATFSIDGLLSLIVMLIALGLLRPSSLGMKPLPFVAASLILIAFVASPAGALRVDRESKTSLATAARGESNTSLEWRLHKWQTLVPRWERSPLIGQGLGTTAIELPQPGNLYVGDPPHNEYLRYLVETGAAGFVVLLGGLGVLIFALIRKLRSARYPRPNMTSMGAALALTILLGCLVNALADNTFLNSPTCYAATLIIFASISQAPERRPIRKRPAEAGATVPLT